MQVGNDNSFIQDDFIAEGDGATTSMTPATTSVTPECLSVMCLARLQSSISQQRIAGLENTVTS